MKNKQTKLRTRFEPDTRFEVSPTAAVPFRGTRETDLDQFKDRLLRSALHETIETEFYALLRRVANEAAATAWMTPFPLLFLPEIFGEKAAAARQQFERAKNIRARSRQTLEEAG